MVHVVYYVPSVPTVKSTTRYAHSAAFPEKVDTCTLITEAEPPAELSERYDDVSVLDGGRISKVRRATKIADEAGMEQTLYVTSFHYEPVLSGFFSDCPWVVDVYDNPHQYALNNPVSYHQLTSRLLTRLIARADGVIHDYHPDEGCVMGTDPRFLLEGCPVNLVEPTYDIPEQRLDCVWAGSPRLDRGMELLIEALGMLDSPVDVAVYGETDTETESRIEQQGVAGQITLHGQQPHEEVLAAISQAQVGLCPLPPRQDWYHSTPLKVREYMAGGTIPLVSDFPGMRYIAESAGVYTSPTPPDIASTLDSLFDVAHNDPSSFQKKMRRCRKRARAQSLSRSNDWFVRQCLASGLDIQLF